MKGSRSRASPLRFQWSTTGVGADKPDLRSSPPLRAQNGRGPAVCGAHPAEDPRPEEMGPTPERPGPHPRPLQAPRSPFSRGARRGHLSPATHPSRPAPALSPWRSARAYPRGVKRQQQPRQQHRKAPPPPHTPHKINDPQRHQNREANKPRRWRGTACSTRWLFRCPGRVGTQPGPGPRCPAARESRQLSRPLPRRPRRYPRPDGAGGRSRPPPSLPGPA